MKVTIAPPAPQLGDYAWLVREEAKWMAGFASIIGADPRMRGRVLDVGCNAGPQVNENKELAKLPAQLDGIDPGPGVHQNPYVRERWQGFFEECDQIPAGVYDAIVSYQVVEHVKDPERFLKAAFRALKPGGAFYATTPHGNHPFALCVRTLDVLGLKNLPIFDKGDGSVNPIPSYYRLNRRSSLVKYGAKAGFDSLYIQYYPNIGWQYFVPRPVRFVAKLYDRLLASRINRMGMLMCYRLEKPGDAAAAAPSGMAG